MECKRSSTDIVSLNVIDDQYDLIESQTRGRGSTSPSDGKHSQRVITKFFPEHAEITKITNDDLRRTMNNMTMMRLNKRRKIERLYTDNIEFEEKLIRMIDWIYRSRILRRRLKRNILMCLQIISLILIGFLIFSNIFIYNDSTDNSLAVILNLYIPFTTSLNFGIAFRIIESKTLIKMMIGKFKILILMRFVEMVGSLGFIIYFVIKSNHTTPENLIFMFLSVIITSLIMIYDSLFYDRSPGNLIWIMLNNMFSQISYLCRFIGSLIIIIQTNTEVNNFTTTYGVIISSIGIVSSLIIITQPIVKKDLDVLMDDYV